MRSERTPSEGAKVSKFSRRLLVGAERGSSSSNGLIQGTVIVYLVVLGEVYRVYQMQLGARKVWLIVLITCHARVEIGCQFYVEHSRFAFQANEFPGACQYHDI